MREYYAKMRSQLMRHDLWPVSRVARIAWYCVRMAVLLFVLGWLLHFVKPAWGDFLSSSVSFFVVVAGIFYCVLLFRVLKKKMLWRLRNRLIVTYVFIGVVPVVLLVAMAFLTLYLFAGQFASFVVTQEIDAQLRNLEAANSAISNELAARIEHKLDPSAESLSGLRKRDAQWERRAVCAWHGHRTLATLMTAQAAAISYPAFFEKESNAHAQALKQKQVFHGVVRDNGTLYLRAASMFPVGGENLTVVTSEPLDRVLVGGIAAQLGEISLYADTGTTADDPKTGVKPKTGLAVTITSDGQTRYLHEIMFVGSVPSPLNIFDNKISFPTPLPFVDWNTGKDEPLSAVVHVGTRPSLLYARLFDALGNGVFAKSVEIGLLTVGAIFTLIEAFALFIGWRMTRTVTGAVANLYDATKSVDRADFSHRIPVTSTDQIAQLSLSFNSMTASIQKLILEQKEKQRLENELAIAQEVQAQLFPREVSQLESLEVHGFCRPARTVSGDYYDYVTIEPHQLILAVGDISGKGISAALLMATISSAVRAYSGQGLHPQHELATVGAFSSSNGSSQDDPEVSPAALLGLLNHQLYESTPPEKYATLFLGLYDGPTRRLTYSNGGHLPPLLISEDGSVRRLECGGTVVGLFDALSWEEDSVVMRPGEIFLAYSDGVTEPENEFGEFGESRLLDLVRENRHLPLAQISQLVTTAVDDWIGDQEQPDDVTLVLARAR